MLARRLRTTNDRKGFINLLLPNWFFKPGPRATMSFMDEAIPTLSDTLAPPTVHGTADLTTFAHHGNGYEILLDHIGRGSDTVSSLYDRSIASQLAFRQAEGLDLQMVALHQNAMYRVGEAPDQALRLLALVNPGDLMTNTPLDFITNHLDVRLDLLYLLPDRPLPATIPDHDVAFFAVGEADPPELERLRRLFALWPRPALNNPSVLPLLERDTLAEALAGFPGLCSPRAVAVDRTALDAHVLYGAPIAGIIDPNGAYPCLIRPLSSHAGAGLARVGNPTELEKYLKFSFENRFFLTPFKEYVSPDGLYRKSRVAFIDREPFLCHMAMSHHWMVHYLNAGMVESAEKRAEEADAMTSFDQGFARRHAAAFDAMHQRLELDYYIIDCAETQDGNLLVFEADAAAIIHMMDPPDLFPYKQPQMRRIFGAFEAMLHRAAGQRR
jgi:hypothetical protein